MCRAHRLLLTAVLTAIATAFIAASASAQSVEMVDEATGTHCGNVVEEANHGVSGGCMLVGASTVSTQTISHTGTSEVVTSGCETELTAHVGPTGGYVSVDDTTIHTNPGAGCFLTPCDEPGAGSGHPEFEWPLSGLFEYGGSQEALVATFCIRTSFSAEGEGNTFCTLIVDIAQTDHEQVLTADQQPCFENPSTELSGQWAATGESDELELLHIHYP